MEKKISFSFFSCTKQQHSIRAYTTKLKKKKRKSLEMSKMKTEKKNTISFRCWLCLVNFSLKLNYHVMTTECCFFSIYLLAWIKREKTGPLQFFAIFFHPLFFFFFWWTNRKTKLLLSDIQLQFEKNKNSKIKNEITKEYSYAKNGLKIILVCNNCIFVLCKQYNARVRMSYRKNAFELVVNIRMLIVWIFTIFTKSFLRMLSHPFRDKRTTI